MKRPAMFLAPFLALFLALGASVTAATPNVGQHIHVEVSNHPVDGFPIARAPYTFHVTIRLHAFPAKVRYLRIDDYSTTRATKTFSPQLAGGGDVAYTFDWTVNFSTWSVGRHELRWHADSQDSDPTPGNGTQRQYTTSRVQVCIQSCSPNVSGRKTPWSGGGSWYTGPGYVVALLTSPDSQVKPGGTISIRSQYQSHVCAYLSPNFHAGSAGTKLGCSASVTIPETAQPGDKLVIVADVSQEAGVYQLVLGDGSPRATTFYGFQSWWAKGGLVIP